MAYIIALKWSMMHIVDLSPGVLVLPYLSCSSPSASGHQTAIWKDGP